MEVPTFRTYRKIGNPSLKRDMKMSPAEARYYKWELDEDPRALSPLTANEPYKTPPLPESAKRAIPNYKEPDAPTAFELPQESMPEVVIPKKAGRKPVAKK